MSPTSPYCLVLCNLRCRIPTLLVVIECRAPPWYIKEAFKHVMHRYSQWCILTFFKTCDNIYNMEIAWPLFVASRLCIRADDDRMASISIQVCYFNDIVFSLNLYTRRKDSLLLQWTWMVTTTTQMLIC